MVKYYFVVELKLNVISILTKCKYSLFLSHTTVNRMRFMRKIIYIV